ncbi:hypothetical protein EQO05_01295 [Methanosarcina sp. MSH10X1]|uniref:hypothetical protein n=1 Tax=Methanosarcina sp. MSH10X1 TaxID=2507075 RepID=UPI000FFCB8AC|nr:hypothetical protein [Methanosarcina sp. MSH10X1]RXA21890.1 hypothetical protein EQO05_01295 [Methanosarcina sp. MSH10X1]
MGIQQSGDRAFSEILGLRDEIGDIQSAIADFEVGKKVNVAIIAGLLGGKTTLINEIEKLNLNRATRITFSGIIRDKEEISLPEDTMRVVLLDNCHFLYTRKPGGFDILYEFLDMISSQDRVFVTTWNLYSWKYLNGAFEIGKYFPVQILIPSLEKEGIRSLILKRYEEGEIIFNNGGESEKEPVIYIIPYPLELASLGRKIIIPVPKINIPYLKRRFLKEEEKGKKKEEETAEYRVFEKIHLESKGNPGVAVKVWELGLHYPHISPEKIGQFSYDIKLEYDEAFILHLILSYQGLKKDEIADMIGSTLRVNETIFRLLNQELIFKLEDDSFRVRPEALRSVIAYLEKLRLVW